MSKPAKHFKFLPEPVFMSLLYRIGGMYVLFGICRLLFVLFNFRYFSITGPAHFFQWLWGGLIFDTVAILYVNILYIVLATIPVPFRYKKWYEAILAVSVCHNQFNCVSCQSDRCFLLPIYIDADNGLGVQAVFK